jgi:hypothetical protein
VVTVDPTGRSLAGGYFAPNSTVFNLNDTVTGNGYLRSVTVQYNQTRLPSASARVWIYGLVIAPGSFLGCSQYLVPASQISTSRTNQTYTLPANAINVFIGTYVGVGIQDTTASIATTRGGVGLRLSGANLSTAVVARSPLFFSLDNPQLGAKISYTLIV